MKLQRIGRPAFAWPDPHMAISSAALRGSGDVAIGLSHTGTTVDTIDALREARSHGATTAAVTNFPWSAITEVAASHAGARMAVAGAPGCGGKFAADLAATAEFARRGESTAIGTAPPAARPLRPGPRG